MAYVHHQIWLESVKNPEKAASFAPSDLAPNLVCVVEDVNAEAGLCKEMGDLCKSESE